jgi:hypothetical protein
VGAAAQERQKLELEPAARAASRQIPAAPQGLAHRRGSPAPWVASEQVRQREPIVEPPIFGLAQRVLDHVRG